MDFRIFLYIIFGILPSLTWLFYYLRKDLHPESKKMILKVFLWGALSTIPVLIVQLSLTKLLNYIPLPSIYFYIIYWFLVIAFTEEIFTILPPFSAMDLPKINVGETVPQRFTSMAFFMPSRLIEKTS